MTKKDFTLIARTIREQRDGSDLMNIQANRFARAFARELRSTNPLFDTERFLAACGVQ